MQTKGEDGTLFFNTGVFTKHCHEKSNNMKPQQVERFNNVAERLVSSLPPTPRCTEQNNTHP